MRLQVSCCSELKDSARSISLFLRESQRKDLPVSERLFWLSYLQREYDSIGRMADSQSCMRQANEIWSDALAQLQQKRRNKEQVDACSIAELQDEEFNALQLSSKNVDDYLAIALDAAREAKLPEYAAVGYRAALTALINARQYERAIAIGEPALRELSKGPKVHGWQLEALEIRLVVAYARAGRAAEARQHLRHVAAEVHYREDFTDFANKWLGKDWRSKL